jgi:hypothetical protein
MSEAMQLDAANALGRMFDTERRERATRAMDLAILLDKGINTEKWK